MPGAMQQDGRLPRPRRGRRRRTPTATATSAPYDRAPGRVRCDARTGPRYAPRRHGDAAGVPRPRQSRASTQAEYQGARISGDYAEEYPPYQITTLHPRTYNEARTIGEHFRTSTPVIMNLSEMDDADAKRLVDFAAGLTFGLHGRIERVTAKVFLLSPHNVTVTAQDKARIARTASSTSPDSTIAVRRTGIGRRDRLRAQHVAFAGLAPWMVASPSWHVPRCPRIEGASVDGAVLERHRVRRSTSTISADPGPTRGRDRPGSSPASWRPAGVAAVGLEVVYASTDPPIKLLRRLVPPLQLGTVSLDLSVMILLLAILALRWVALTTRLVVDRILSSGGSTRLAGHCVTCATHCNTCIDPHLTPEPPGSGDEHEVTECR